MLDNLLDLYRNPAAYIPGEPMTHPKQPTCNLYWKGKKTNAYYKLQDAMYGTTVARRYKGYSDYPLCCDLVRAGYCEWRATGPQGGKRLHATDKGRAILAADKVTPIRGTP